MRMVQAEAEMVYAVQVNKTCSSEAVEVDCLGFLIFAGLVGGMEFKSFSSPP